MKIYYKLNENRIVQTSNKRFDGYEGCIVAKDYPMLNDLSAYTVTDGKIVYVGLPESVKAARAEENIEARNAQLRTLRQKVCFDICDRAAWYDGLTDTQKAEVQAWRKAWLNVTETLVIPAAPDFVDAEPVTMPEVATVVEPEDMSGEIVYLIPTGRYELDESKIEQDRYNFFEDNYAALNKSKTEARDAALDAEIADIYTQIASTQRLISEATDEYNAIKAPEYTLPEALEAVLSSDEEPDDEAISAARDADDAYEAEYYAKYAQYQEDVAKVEAKIQSYHGHIEALTLRIENIKEQKQSVAGLTDAEIAAIYNEWDEWLGENIESYCLKDEYGDYREIYTEEL